jgi:hypothetical protein
MSLSVHKNVDSKITKKDLNNHSDIIEENNPQIKKKDGGIVNSGGNDTPSLNIERENRLAKVLSLFSKGLSQEEIAH